jgi:hypothetical protein
LCGSGHGGLVLRDDTSVPSRSALRFSVESAAGESYRVAGETHERRVPAAVEPNQCWLEHVC